MDISSGLQAPAEISANAPEPGIIVVEFRGEPAGDTAYEIWRRHGDTVDWYLHATADEPAFEDQDVEPGQYYEYKVRATRGGEVSEFSTSVVVYGT